MFERVAENAMQAWEGLIVGIKDFAKDFAKEPTLSGKFSSAHSVAFPIVLIGAVLVWWLDKYDGPWEKIIYIVYLIIGVELLVFLTIFLTILGQ